MGASVNYQFIANEQQASEPIKTRAQVRMEAANSDEHLMLARQVWGTTGKSWQRLYLILETVESHLNLGHDKEKGYKRPTAADHGLCNKADYERFCRTVNHAEVAGIDVRHGLGVFAPPTEPMTINEGIDFIQKLFEKTLDRRAALLAQASSRHADEIAA